MGPTAGERQTFTFRSRHPISTYLLAFAAGRLQVETAERDGRTLRLLHRETDAEKVARNVEDIFDLHATALSWLEDYTGIDYPFEKFDFVLMPAFQYGGMEHPGAILYRARSLFLDESATQNDLLSRASLIAHETAHMWFGNLVTMEWFDDVWMKEVLANFMAAKIINPSFPEVDHELRFLLAHYPRAYEVDRTAGANPIRQPLANLNEAGSLYGAIIYQKAPIVMRHLELLLGEADFRDGIREYLEGHRYANASWPDLIEVMDTRTDRDLRAWSATWVNEPGRPTVSADLEVEDGTIAALTLRQTDPHDNGRAWPQKLQLLLGQGAEEHRIDVDLRQATLEVTEAVGLPAPGFVLANGAGVGYGRFALDPSSREALLEGLPEIANRQTRAIAWLSLWDAMLEGEVEPRHWVDLAMRALSVETDELNIQRVLDHLTAAFWRYLPEASRGELAPNLEAHLWQRLEAAPNPRLRAAYFAAYRDVALSAEAISRLRRIWAGDVEVTGLPLAENDLVTLALELAVRGVNDSESLLDAQLERIENPDRRTRFEFVRPALSADPTMRERFFASLTEPANRQQERWVLEALGYLHHPLRATSSAHLIRPGLELLEEIQQTGDIFFPLGWLQGTLSGHNSPQAADIVREFLHQTPDLPPRLRGKLLQAADPLFR
ncbi:MAG: M1 family aminopeptidase, partial [Acidobacteriota bacterium]